MNGTLESANFHFKLNVRYVDLLMYETPFPKWDFSKLFKVEFLTSCISKVFENLKKNS